jgi:hypothetical protein
VRHHCRFSQTSRQSGRAGREADVRCDTTASRLSIHFNLLLNLISALISPFKFRFLISRRHSKNYQVAPRNSLSGTARHPGWTRFLCSWTWSGRGGSHRCPSPFSAVSSSGFQSLLRQLALRKQDLAILSAVRNHLRPCRQFSARTYHKPSSGL